MIHVIIYKTKKKQRQHPTESDNHHAVLHANKLALIILLLCYPAETALSRTLLAIYIPYPYCNDAGKPKIVFLVFQK